MSYNSTFAHISENEESNQSVNPISTLASSSQTPMDDDTNENGDNAFAQLSLCRRLGNANLDNKIDRPRTLRECLAPRENSGPFMYSLSPHAGIFHFRNGMISLLP